MNRIEILMEMGASFAEAAKIAEIEAEREGRQTAIRLAELEAESETHFFCLSSS